jgi:phage head maturation protease
MSKYESRSIKVEMRVDNETKEIVGTIPFDQETVVGNYFREVIRSSFFDRAINDGDDIVAWVEHGLHGELPFAGTRNNTLKLTNNGDHLEWRAKPVEATDVDILRTRLESGLVNATSFSFQVDDSDKDQVIWDRSEKDKLPLRELRSASRILDVSPVTFAAYGGTSLGLRADQRSAESIYKEYADSVVIQEDSPEDRGASEVQEDRDMAGVIDILLNH